MTVLIWLMICLTIKHFIVDFPLQNKYQWSNKGTYGHKGGILHSLLHGYFTLGILMFFVSWPLAIQLAWLDALLHYHIDWAKMNLNAKLNWKPNTHEEFWWLLGLDQFLHYLTYIAIIAIAVQNL